MPAKTGPSYQMSHHHRDKIKNSNILNALVEHVEGQREMSSTQVTAGIALLKKIMPDLAAVQHSNDPDNPITRQAHEYTDAELLARIAGMGSPATSETPPRKSKLN